MEILRTFTPPARWILARFARPLSQKQAPPFAVHVEELPGAITGGCSNPLPGTPTCLRMGSRLKLVGLLPENSFDIESAMDPSVLFVEESTCQQHL